jgi:cell division protease FtsH
MDQSKRPMLIGVLLFFLIVTSFLVYNEDSMGRVKDVDFSSFKSMVENGKFSSVRITGTDLVGTAVPEKDPKTDDAKVPARVPPTLYRSTANDPALVGLLAALDAKGTPYRIEQQTDNTWIWQLVFWVVILFLVFRVLGGALGQQGKRIDRFASSKAKLITSEDRTKVTFADVAGNEEAKAGCQEFVECLRNPRRFTKVGARIPKGILLTGPTGTGKTLLARAIAGEADVPFFKISGSEFVEMFVGVGAARVRDLFEQGLKNAPCIIFIDEIDAVGQKRGQGVSGGGHEEREQTLNQLLVEMDGFAPNSGVLILAATNRPDTLDSALLRPGRFDRKIEVGLPDVNGREAILAVHAKKVKLGPDADLRTVARGTPGFSGADIENLINEAALAAARADREVVTAEDLEVARDRAIMGGPERRTLVMSPELKRTIAVHEAGHTVVGLLDPDHDPVHKVSIIPRGGALGVTAHLPLDDKFLYTKEQLVSKLRSLMGGRVAERLVIGRITTGASNDLQVATGIAKALVIQYGMSDDLPPRTFGNRYVGYLGTEEGARDYSEETAQRIDREVGKYLLEAQEFVTNLLTQRRSLLDAISAALLERETLTAAHLQDILQVHQLAPQPA